MAGPAHFYLEEATRAFCPYLLTTVLAGSCPRLRVSRHEFPLIEAEQLTLQYLGDPATGPARVPGTGKCQGYLTLPHSEVAGCGGFEGSLAANRLTALHRPIHSHKRGSASDHRHCYQQQR